MHAEPDHLKVLAAVARHGSVTEAAKELHYSQPSVSHHLGRLEAATGARLIQRVGRGIRLAPEGELLAGRATEILARVDAASVELFARVGLRAGRVRLAGFQTVPQYPRTEGSRRAVPVAPGNRVEPRRCPPGRGPEDAAFRSRRHRLDLPARRHSAGGGRIPTHPPAGRPLYLISDQPHQRPEDHRDSVWLGGCERCRAATITACERAGFSPRIAHSFDDTVVVQSLVAAGMGVAILNGLALHAHRAPGIHTTQLTDSARQIYAATYGDPPDPPATTALIEILASIGMTLRAPSRDEVAVPALVSQSSTSTDRR